MTIDIQINNEYSNIVELTKDYTPLISRLVQFESMDCFSVTIIYVTDVVLARMHSDFLDDPTETDVMAFDLGDDHIEAELYISVDRAKDHAQQFNVSLENELTRLVIHGLLHLTGYDDHSEDGIKRMREREHYYLNMQI